MNKNKEYTCPECHDKEGVDILYGYPSEDTLQSWFKKDV